ncbi:MAG: lytic transglycosylase domain-containing protein [Thermoanaerobaculum sp.]|nr:lytic transglycosylase domain-containing protein [Thermoanaerobaculum sp.]
MATRTPWVCKLLFLSLALFLPACAKQAPPPTLAEALAVEGSPARRAKAYLKVALVGPAQERRDAALLWGLYACEAGSPTAAVRAFSLAQPSGGLAVLAARRLEEALVRFPPPPRLLADLQKASWLPSEAWERLVLETSEALLRQGNTAAAQELLANADSFSAKNRPRALLLAARLGAAWPLPEQQRLLLTAPREFLSAFPQQRWRDLAQGFGRQEWEQLAQAFLASGEPALALEAARRAGTGAAEVAAQAAIALRRPQEARRWAEALPRALAARHLLLAQALRQQAWGADGAVRVQFFAQMVEAARAAAGLAEGAQKAEAQLLWAEALVETGVLGEVPALLAASAPHKPPRWEWVARRALRAFALRGQSLALPAEVVGPRLSRLAHFWSAWSAWRRGQPEALQQLASSGHPDLPARWAARLTNRPLRWQPLQDQPVPAQPPAWAAWLMAAGRVADVVLAWRAELERGEGSSADWLGLIRLAQYPPLDTIPILLRAEPRLLAGPWSAVPRALLAQYLPLPYRAELEAAAGAQQIPPWLLAALVRQESAFNPRARSTKGALGLAQLLPATAGLPPAVLLEPAANLRAGAAHLRALLNRYGGAWEPALAAYNAGEGRIGPAWERTGRREGPLFVEALELPETWDYVHRVLLFAEGYRLLYWPQQAET